jgi:hypothetical protein
VLTAPGSTVDDVESVGLVLDDAEPGPLVDVEVVGVEVEDVDVEVGLVVDVEVDDVVEVELVVELDVLDVVDDVEVEVVDDDVDEVLLDVLEVDELVDEVLELVLVDELVELVELDDELDELEEDELVEVDVDELVVDVALGSTTSIDAVAWPCSAGGGVLPPSSTTTVTEAGPSVVPIAVRAPSWALSEARSPERLVALGVAPTPEIVAVRVPLPASESVTENGIATDDPMFTTVAAGAVTTGGSFSSSRTVMSNDAKSNPRGSGIATPTSRLGFIGWPLLPRSWTSTLMVSSASSAGVS